MNVAAIGLLAQVGSALPISDSTAISLATVLVLIGAAWTLSSKLSAIVTRLDALSQLPDKVQKLELEVGGLKGGVKMLEADVNNLWMAYRQDPPDTVRREGRLNAS